MPLFRLQENRYINSDHISDITYSPAGSVQIVRVGGDGEPVGQQRPPNSYPSWLNIDLKDTEHIRLEGEEADAAWAEFEAIAQALHHSTGQGRRPAPHEYGILSFSIDTWRHVFEGNGFGDDYTNLELYQIFNTLARSGWEPHLFWAPDPSSQIWIMRRSK